MHKKQFPMPRFESTRIFTSDSDTLTAARQPQYDSKHVLVLNMANRVTAGGGLASGAMAQEEDLCRRTDLMLSLTSAEARYPMEEFTATISENITIFRGTEKEGYRLFSKAEMRQIDVLSIAAFNASGVAGSQVEQFTVAQNLQIGSEKVKTFTDVGFAKTAKNIMTLLLSAISHTKADVLILGALGCGGFANPSREVAAIFQELLPLVSGYFEVVEFAILSQETSDVLKQFDGAFASIRTLPRIPGYSVTFPLAVDGKSNKVDIAFSKCLKGEECKIRGEERNERDPVCRAHKLFFSHPQPCTNLHCPFVFSLSPTQVQTDHLKNFSHRPVCRKAPCLEAHETPHYHMPECSAGLLCDQRVEQSAVSSHKGDKTQIVYFHKPKKCPHGDCCNHLRDRAHTSVMSHNVTDLCPISLVQCPHLRDEAHCQRYAHYCPHGFSCQKKNEPAHRKAFLHVERNACELRKHDENTPDWHWDIYEHGYLVRSLCKDGARCLRKDDQHRQQYCHPPQVPPRCNVVGLNFYKNLGTTKAEKFVVDFEDNARCLINSMNMYWEQNGQKFNEKLVKEVEAMLRKHLFVHRCKPEVFSSVYETGGFTSLFNLQHTTHHIDALKQFPAVSALLTKYEGEPHYLQAVNDLIEGYYQLNIDLRSEAAENREYLVTRSQNNCTRLRVPVDSIASQLADKVEKAVQRYFEIVDNLIRTEFGIGYSADAVVQTTTTVFTIHGPHRLNYGPFHVIFGSDILFHPDAYILPVAATAYASEKKWDLSMRPWDEMNRFDEPFNIAARQRLHPSSPSCFTALAMELIARTYVVDSKQTKEKKYLANVTMDGVRAFWKTQDAHNVFEGHLPPVPINCVERTFVAKRELKPISLLPEIRACFADRLVQKESLEDAARSAFEYAHNASDVTLHRLSGFSMTLGMMDRPAPLPFDLQGEMLFYVLFHAKGAPFSIIISDDDLPLACPSFTVDTTEATASDGASSIADAEFSLDVPVNSSFIGYCIEYNHIKKELRMYHTGWASYFSKKEICLPCKKTSSIFVMVPGADVSFSGFTVKTDSYLFEEYEKVHSWRFRK